MHIHLHKSITDTLDTVKIAKNWLVPTNKQRKGHFGKFELGFVHGPSKILAPQVSKRSAASNQQKSY